jgi:hypothetical protein
VFFTTDAFGKAIRVRDMILKKIESDIVPQPKLLGIEQPLNTPPLDKQLPSENPLPHASILSKLPE